MVGGWYFLLCNDSGIRSYNARPVVRHGAWHDLSLGPVLVLGAHAGRIHGRWLITLIKLALFVLSFGVVDSRGSTIYTFLWCVACRRGWCFTSVYDVLREHARISVHEHQLSEPNGRRIVYTSTTWCDRLLLLLLYCVNVPASPCMNTSYQSPTDGVRTSTTWCDRLLLLLRCCCVLLGVLLTACDFFYQPPLSRARDGRYVLSGASLVLCSFS